jgi:hypothetical protein
MNWSLPALAALTVAALLFVLGCETGYKIIYGPASLTMGATPVTPGVSVTIEADGVAWFGEDKPTGEELGYLIASPDDEAVE